MIIYSGAIGSISSFDIPKDLVLAIGNFDGVHLGHQKVINTCIEIAKHNKATTGILTFDPHPSTIIDKGYNKKLIYTNTRKLEMLKTFPLTCIFILAFDINLMKLTHDEFIKSILIDKFNIKGLVSGENFHFGYKGQGDINILNDFSKKYGFLYYAVEKHTQNGLKVSSSKIRELLSMGMIETTNKLLDREYAIDGKIVHGKKLAQTLQVKTANILLDEQYSYPMMGVYLVKITLLDEKTKLYGIANIGVRPTVSNENQPSLEVHIFDFDEDIYGKNIRVEFLHFIRPERNFDNIDALKMQIMKDIKDAKYVHLFF